MARKKTAPKQPKMTETFTLKQAVDFVNSLKNPQSTKDGYIRHLTNLVANAEEDPLYNGKTSAELLQSHQEVNIVPILKDFDSTSDIIENKIKSKKDGGGIADDTKKQYYAAVRILMTKKAAGHLELGKELMEQYQAKIKEFDDLSNQRRRQNLPIRGNLEHPDLTYEVMLKLYQDFTDTHAFTNTEKGRKDLKYAVLVGLFVLQRPRRVDDWHQLMWHSKLPTEEERKGKNIVHIEKDRATIYIDRFKTRTRTKNNTTKELLPTYIKVLNPKLTSLLKDYIKKMSIRDMSKLTRDEKRQNKEFYIFHLEEKPDQTYKDAGGLGDVITTAMFKVFGKRKVSANTVRHAFNDWLSEHMKEFTDAQLREIAIDVGDTPRDLPTNLRYRIARQENVGMTKTEIQGMLEDDEYAKGLALAAAEEEGSVAGGDVQHVSNLVHFPTIEEEQEESGMVQAPFVEKAWTKEEIVKRLGELEQEKARLWVMLLGKN
jgi:hypothetical protein